MTRPARIAALLVGLAALGGCDRALTGLPNAAGPIPDVMVVADSVTYRGIVGEALREELAAPVPTLPSRQGPFKLTQIDPESRLATRARGMRLVVYAAPVDEDSPVGEMLRASLDPAQLAAVRAGRAEGFVLREDLWARGQVVVFLTAATDTALAATILRHGDTMRRAFARVAREATAADIFSRHRQTDLEQRMLDALGVGVRVQYDFVVSHDTTLVADGRTGRVMRLRRVLTGTWRDYFLFVQDGVDAIPDHEAIDRLTDDVLRQIVLGSEDGSFVQQDEQRPVSRDTVRLGDRPAHETRGLWYMTNDLMGGPYVRYATIIHPDEPGQASRLVVFYGMIYAPDRMLDKREFLRQMEATAYTLRVKESAPGAED